MTSAVEIDVISDVICPWCFLGKRRLDAAAKLVPDIKLNVTFRPFFLDPTIPAEGLDRQQYMLAKFGSERLKTIHDPLNAAGEAEGVPFRFDRITRTPNTMDAHRLLRWGAQRGVQHSLAEDLFMAYWHFGEDVSDRDVLKTLAINNGLDGEQIAALLRSETDKQAVLQEAQQAQLAGINGVPTFVLANRYGFAGAQPPDVLAQAIRRVAAQQQAA